MAFYKCAIFKLRNKYCYGIGYHLYVMDTLCDMDDSVMR